jgi:hypothetical protein
VAFWPLVLLALGSLSVATIYGHSSAKHKVFNKYILRMFIANKYYRSSKDKTDDVSASILIVVKSYNSASWEANV